MVFYWFIFFFSKKGVLGDSYGITNMWRILHSDFNPYNIYMGDGRGIYILGRRLWTFKLINEYTYPLKPISIYTIPDTYYYGRGLLYIYNTYYIILLLFLTILHTLSRLKHLFNDYLRDFDKNLVLFYYYIFCFICLYFFFVNLTQVYVCILNFFNLEHLLYFIIVYIFFFFLFSIYLFNIVVLTVNSSKKTLNLNFIFYAFLLILIGFLFFTFSFFLQKWVEDVQIYFSYINNPYRPANTLVFFANTNEVIPAQFPTRVDALRRKAYQQYMFIYWNGGNPLSVREIDAGPWSGYFGDKR